MFIIINVNSEFVNVRECYAFILLAAINNSGQSLPEKNQLSAMYDLGYCFRFRKIKKIAFLKVKACVYY